MRVAAEAGQQEVEIGQFGDPVRADVVASAVGQGVDGLSCWTHLKKRKRVEIKCAYKTHFMSPKLVIFMCFFSPPPTLGHYSTLPDKISNPFPRLLECSCSSWILLEMLFWAGWGRVFTDVDRTNKGSCQACRRERASDNKSDSCRGIIEQQECVGQNKSLWL